MSPLRTTCQASAWVKRSLTVNTPCCANAIASCSGRSFGSAPRLAARKVAMSRAEEYICPVPGQLNTPCWLPGAPTGCASEVVALHRAAAKRRCELAARIGGGHRHHRRTHAERRSEPRLHELGDRRVEAPLQREREQEEAGVGIDLLLAGHMRVVGLPGIEIADEVGQPVRSAMPGLVLLRRAG